jgi:hypothetical protein
MLCGYEGGPYISLAKSMSFGDNTRMISREHVRCVAFGERQGKAVASCLLHSDAVSVAY